MSKNWTLRSMFKKFSILSAFLCSLFLAATTDAAMMFSGTITSVDDPLGLFADAKVGDSVSGYFYYSTAPSDWGFVGNSGVLKNYQTTNPDTSIWDLLVKVSTDTTTITNKDAIEPLSLYSVQLGDNPTTGASLDSLAILAYHGNIFQPTPLVTEVNLNFNDVGGALFSGDSPPAEIIFANADQRVGDFSFLVDTNHDGIRETRSYVQFSIDTLTDSPVPEPASLAIWGGIGLIGLVAGWRQRRSQLA